MPSPQPRWKAAAMAGWVQGREGQVAPGTQGVRRLQLSLRWGEGVSGEEEARRGPDARG